VPKIETSKSGYQVLPDDNARIVRDFIDFETGYRVVCERKNDDLITNITTLNAESGEIVLAKDRKSNIGESVAQAEGYEIRTVRRLDPETSNELVQETLIAPTSGEVLHSRERVAFQPTAPTPILSLYSDRLERESVAEDNIRSFQSLPREEQIRRLTREFRQARRARAELGDDENTIFDPDQFASYREMAPEIETMLEEIFRGVFIGCWPKDEADARRRLGMRPNNAA